MKISEAAKLRRKAGNISLTDLFASQPQPFGKDTSIQTPRRFFPIMHEVGAANLNRKTF
jgi:hypothetical protein